MVHDKETLPLGDRIDRQLSFILEMPEGQRYCVDIPVSVTSPTVIYYQTVKGLQINTAMFGQPTIFQRLSLHLDCALCDDDGILM